MFTSAKADANPALEEGKDTNLSQGIRGRPAIGQKADRTIILVVIDGRQPTWSLGIH